MKTLRKPTTQKILGFTFHLPQGYPAPSRDTMIRALNEHLSTDIMRFHSRNAVKQAFGDHVKMVCNWQAGNTPAWEVSEVFFTKIRN